MLKATSIRRYYDYLSNNVRGGTSFLTTFSSCIMEALNNTASIESNRTSNLETEILEIDRLIKKFKYSFIKEKEFIRRKDELNYLLHNKEVKIKDLELFKQEIIDQDLMHIEGDPEKRKAYLLYPNKRHYIIKILQEDPPFMEDFINKYPNISVELDIIDPPIYIEPTMKEKSDMMISEILDYKITFKDLIDEFVPDKEKPKFQELINDQKKRLSEIQSQIKNNPYYCVSKFIDILQTNKELLSGISQLLEGSPTEMLALSMEH